MTLARLRSHRSNLLAGSTPTAGEAGPCQGERPTAARIGCLQPDRRVDLEVTGNR